MDLLANRVVRLIASFLIVTCPKLLAFKRSNVLTTITNITSRSRFRPSFIVFRKIFKNCIALVFTRNEKLSNSDIFRRRSNKTARSACVVLIRHIVADCAEDQRSLDGQRQRVGRVPASRRHSELLPDDPVESGVDIRRRGSTAERDS